MKPTDVRKQELLRSVEQLTKALDEQRGLTAEAQKLAAYWEERANQLCQRFADEEDELQLVEAWRSKVPAVRLRIVQDILNRPR